MYRLHKFGWKILYSLHNWQNGPAALANGPPIIPYPAALVKRFLKKFFQSTKKFFVNSEVAQIFISVFVQLVNWFIVNSMYHKYDTISQQNPLYKFHNVLIEKEKKLENLSKKWESQLEKDYLERKNTKEDYLEKEMNEKLRFNLKNTIDDKNVDFNYRVIGQKIKVKNKNDPYKEYLDFYHEFLF